VPSTGIGQVARPARTSPVWPLLATLGMQTLATMAAFSIPAAAPAVAHDLGVPAALVGFFVAAVYGVGILSSLLSPGFVLRYGPVRVIQVILLSVMAMLLAASGGTLPLVVLVPHTPRHVFNLVMSIRQVGVPLGGVFAGLIVPPLALAIGWRGALLAELPASLLLLVLLQMPRQAWDAGREPRQPVFGATLARSVSLWRESAAIRRLSIASFVYTGVQLAFIAFMTVHLTQDARFGLVQAGWTLAAYQVAGAVSRPTLGWVADRMISAWRLLALLGGAMCVAAVAAGFFSAGWARWEVVAVCLLAGASASGFTGLAYAEYARLGGTRRTEATGLGSAVMFAGVLVIPPVFGLAATALGGFTPSYIVLGLMALGCGLLMRRAPRQ
jgi:nitrate/nitrite transporter NarK